MAPRPLPVTSEPFPGPSRSLSVANGLATTILFPSTSNFLPALRSRKRREAGCQHPPKRGGNPAPDVTVLGRGAVEGD